MGFQHQRVRVKNSVSPSMLMLTCSSIAKAAKEMRVKVHPDKLIKLGMPETEIGKINDTAARVGQAAEILLDPVKVSY